jgi:hypothetical protein
MIEVTSSDGDGKYTEKSAIYQAAFRAVYPGCAGGSVLDFVEKLLRQIPSLAHMDVDTFQDWMGLHLQPGMEFAKKQLPRLVAP